jgi:hydroxymethylglutaryl-CoA synthase
MRKVGIVGYGSYLPIYRLKTEDVACVWKKNAGEVLNSLGIKEKSVPGVDEDAVTLAIEAGFWALKTVEFDPHKVETLLVGSESHPYAVNPTSTIVGEFLGFGNNYLASDLEFACKAGSAGVQMIAGLIGSGHIKYGLAVGTDTAQSKTHDALEYTSASGSAAFLLGGGGVAVELLNFTSCSSDTPDFWRRDGISYPSHAGRFTGEPAYFAHVVGAARALMKKAKVSAKNVDYCIFHMPNARFPREVAVRLGFTEKQLAPSLIVEDIGNPYSASSLLGLAAALDQVKPGEVIFMVSYGSGAGSDAFLWRVNKEIIQIQVYRKKNNLFVREQIRKKVYIDYARYLHQMHKI